jgi:hypothetical protein
MFKRLTGTGLINKEAEQIGRKAYWVGAMVSACESCEDFGPGEVEPDQSGRLMSVLTSAPVNFQQRARAAAEASLVRDISTVELTALRRCAAVYGHATLLTGTAVLHANAAFMTSLQMRMASPGQDLTGGHTQYIASLRATRAALEDAFDALNQVAQGLTGPAPALLGYIMDGPIGDHARTVVRRMADPEPPAPPLPSAPARPGSGMPPAPGTNRPRR